MVVLASRTAERFEKAPRGKIEQDETMTEAIQGLRQQGEVLAELLRRTA